VADGPVIVAESEGVLQELTVSEAVMQLDLTDKAFLLFRNAAHGRVSVVHRRADGHIGWIDPKPELRTAVDRLNGATVDFPPKSAV
jgi:hypothetical protein